MLARDEEELLKKHLKLWREVGDSFLLGLDSRNQDRAIGRMRCFGEKRLGG